LTGFEIRQIIEPTPEMAAVIQKCVEECVQRELREMVERIVEEKLNSILGGLVGSTQEIELRVLPIPQAKDLIKKYVDENPGCLTSDIIINLGLEPRNVLEAISQLQREEKLRGENIEYSES